MDVLKAFLLFLFGIVSLSFVYFASMLDAKEHACFVKYNDAILTNSHQMQSIYADKPSLCQESFDTIAEWADCSKKAETIVPTSLLPVVRTAVDYVVGPARQRLSISAAKNEHDLRCAKDSEFIFGLSQQEEE